MPEGERSFAASKGQQKKLTFKVSPETYVLLKIAAATYGTSPSTEAAAIIERWAERFLACHTGELAAGLEAERSRRAQERRSATASTSSGRHVQEGE